MNPQHAVLRMNPQYSVLSINPQYSVLSINPQYSVLSINPQYSVLSINPRQRKKRPLPCVLSRKNTTERLIHPVYREFQHSADGFPSQDFKTVVNAVDERVRGFRLMVKEHEGSFSWSRTMRVSSSLSERRIWSHVPWTWGSLERNTSKRLIDRFYGGFGGSHDGFPSQGFQTPGNAVYERVRGFGLVSFGYEGLVSCPTDMRVWSCLPVVEEDTKTRMWPFPGGA
jgi:hypothetical protein